MLPPTILSGNGNSSVLHAPVGAARGPRQHHASFSWLPWSAPSGITVTYCLSFWLRFLVHISVSSLWQQRQRPKSQLAVSHAPMSAVHNPRFCSCLPSALRHRSNLLLFHIAPCNYLPACNYLPSCLSGRVASSLVSSLVTTSASLKLVALRLPAAVFGFSLLPSLELDRAWLPLG